MKLNGWQRALIVIFALWSVSVLFISWKELNRTAESSSEIYYSLCNIDNEKETKKTDCWKVKSEAFNKSFENGLKQWWVIPLAILSLPILIIIVWGLCFLFISIFYWIYQGFKKEINTKNKVKFSNILTVFVVSLFFMFVVVSNFLENSKKAKFEKELANCQLDIIESKINYESKFKYTESCLISKGYRKKQETYCNDEYSSETYYCYE